MQGTLNSVYANNSVCVLAKKCLLDSRICHEYSQGPKGELAIYQTYTSVNMWSHIPMWILKT